MKKVFDVSSDGNVTDVNGVFLGCCTNLDQQPDANQDEKLSIKQVQQLKEAGLETDEIIKLKDSGTI
tara:strand:- start:331 stop:531 length:201 start_codon:yes stop_codon:yes gene_type:complete